MFQDRLRAAREARRLDQAGLASRSGLTIAAISHFETGRRRPSMGNLVRLADALSVTTDYLMGRADAMTGAAGSPDRVMTLYHGLPVDYQEIAQDFVAMLARR